MTQAKFADYNLVSYTELSDQAVAEGRAFTGPQLAVLNNLLFGVIRDKLSLRIDQAAPLVRIQEDAYLQGKFDILTTLLNPKEF